MSPAGIVALALQISIALIVFALALQAGPGDLTYLLRRPSLLIRSVLAMNVVMPVVAALVAVVFDFRPDLETALMVLAVSPVPPILPNKQSKAGGDASYAVGLLATAAVVAIVAVPVSVTVLGRWFGHALHVPMGTIAVVLVKSVLGPLLAGVLVRTLVPALAARNARLLSLIGTLVLLLGVVLILVRVWPAVAAAAGGNALIAITLFVLAGLGVGHLLGGPVPEDRTVLALATASRHPGVAVAIVGAIAPDKEAVARVAATVLLCVLVSVLVTVPYVKWRKRSDAAPRPTVGSPASG
jgi:BASS family bile acid:Na+ symporter